jgi:hypothetical protein
VTPPGGNDADPRVAPAVEFGCSYRTRWWSLQAAYSGASRGRVLGVRRHGLVGSQHEIPVASWSSRRPAVHAVLQVPREPSGGDTCHQPVVPTKWRLLADVRLVSVEEQPGLELRAVSLAVLPNPFPWALFASDELRTGLSSAARSLGGRLEGRATPQVLCWHATGPCWRDRGPGGGTRASHAPSRR